MDLPSKEHIHNFCIGGDQGEPCSYFVIGEKAECAKAWPYLVQAIKARLAAGEMNAKGDNCSGPPKFISNLKLRVV